LARATATAPLRLRPRDHHPPVDHELEAVEVAVPNDVGRRFVRQTAAQQFLEAAQGIVGEFLVGVGDDPGAVLLERIHEQDFGLQVRVLDLRPYEPKVRALKDVGQFHTRAFSSSFACSLVATESMISSISPLSIAGMLWKFPPMRWSDTRSWGKL
jgi:hypothetical protein